MCMVAKHTELEVKGCMISWPPMLEGNRYNSLMIQVAIYHELRDKKG